MARLENRIGVRLEKRKAEELATLCSAIGLTESQFIRLLLDYSVPLGNMIKSEIGKGAKSPEEIFSGINGRLTKLLEEQGVKEDEEDSEFFEELGKKYIEIAELWRKRRGGKI